jgi:hypothetical protein
VLQKSNSGWDLSRWGCGHFADDDDDDDDGDADILLMMMMMMGMRTTDRYTASILQHSTRKTYYACV